MNRKSLAAAVVLGSLAITIIAEFARSQDFVFADSLIENLSDRKTRAQRDAYWTQVDGKLADVVGRVTDVKGSGWILPAMIEMDLPPTWESSVTCGVSPEYESRITEINIGDMVGCVGKLSHYTILFGYLSVGILGAEFSKIDR